MLGKPIIYRSVSGGTDYTINNRTANFMSTTPFYYIAVTSVDGFLGGDISFEEHDRPNVTGSEAGDVFRRGKTVTLSGNIEGRGFAELYNGAFYLHQMFSETGRRKLIFTPWNYNIQLYLWCKISQDLNINMQVNSNTYKWPFVVGLRASDPRMYKLSDDSLFPTYQ